jgi:uncharacterized protein YdeI (YjbR/CyaY-like superfamily)
VYLQAIAMPEPRNVIYFRSAAELRKWFKAHHRKAEELWVGFYKKQSGTPSVTWPESVDEALCVGWIDGIRKSVAADSYTIRFSPRRKGSIWSAVNMRRVKALTDEKRMLPPGLKAYAARLENKSGIYSYEQRSEQLPDPYAAEMKKHKAAWAFFQAQAPYYRKMLGWWIVSAKKEETRRARLKTLIDASEKGKRLR